MFERPRVTVNCPNGQVFPIRNLEAARSAPISTAANVSPRFTSFPRFPGFSGPGNEGLDENYGVPGKIGGS
jgi:hypothetical protein